MRRCKQKQHVAGCCPSLPAPVLSFYSSAHSKYSEDCWQEERKYVPTWHLPGSYVPYASPCARILCFPYAAIYIPMLPLSWFLYSCASIMLVLIFLCLHFSGSYNRMLPLFISEEIDVTLSCQTLPVSNFSIWYYQKYYSGLIIHSYLWTVTFTTFQTYIRAHKHMDILPLNKMEGIVRK